MPNRRSLATKIGRALAAVFRHSAATLVALMMALLGAESTTVSIALIVVGAALDVLRHRHAPDFQRDEAAIVKEFAAVAANPAALKAGHAASCYGIMVPIYGLSFVYTIFWMLVDSSGSLAQAYLQSFDCVNVVLFQFFEIIRRHTMELASHGYTARSLLAAHIYTVHYLTFVIGTAACFWSASWHHAHLIIASKATLPPEVRLKIRRRTGSYPMFYLTFAIFPYAFMAKFMPIDWEPGSLHPWNIHVSNVPYFWSYMGIVGSSMMISEAYTWVLLYLYDLHEER